VSEELDTALLELAGKTTLLEFRLLPLEVWTLIRYAEIAGTHLRDMRGRKFAAGLGVKLLEILRPHLSPSLYEKRLKEIVQAPDS
jgi:hypothetical protein